MRPTQKPALKWSPAPVEIFGFGVKGQLGGNAYRFDYAWAGHEYLDDTHRLTMVVEF